MDWRGTRRVDDPDPSLVPVTLTPDGLSPPMTGGPVLEEGSSSSSRGKPPLWGSQR